jgi:GntR family transcriptional regulator
MKLRIDIQAPVPVYRQIVDGLRLLLVDGELKPGDQLPPVRRLAMDLNVHFNTVAEAYRALAQEGWLEIARHSGAKVVSRAMPRGSGPETSQSFRKRLRELAAELQARGVSRGRIVRELRQLAETLERV